MLQPTHSRVNPLLQGLAHLVGVGLPAKKATRYQIRVPVPVGADGVLLAGVAAGAGAVVAAGAALAAGAAGLAAAGLAGAFFTAGFLAAAGFAAGLAAAGLAAGFPLRFWLRVLPLRF